MPMPTETDRIKLVLVFVGHYSEPPQRLVDCVGLAQGTEHHHAAGPDDRKLSAVPTKIRGRNIGDRATLRCPLRPLRDRSRQSRMRLSPDGRIAITPSSFVEKLIGQREQGEVR